VGHCAASAWPSTAVDLRAIYKRVYDTIPWPEPIPSPGQVTLRWKRRVTRVLGSCYPYKKTITISPLYQDGRLYGEIADLMTHEAGHFIWQGHPSGFQRFLRSVSIAPHYISNSSPPSAAFQAVWAEQSIVPSIWACPACGAAHASANGHHDVCCGRCAGRWDPQLRFPFAFHDARNGHRASRRSPLTSRNAKTGGR
jgi:hypothetical protein